MKTNRFLCFIFAAFIALSSLCLSATAETVEFPEYSSLPVLSSGQAITWGSSYAINFGGNVYQGYSASCKGASSYPICEKIGLFNHILNAGEEAVIGELTIRYKDNYYCEILKSGSLLCSYSVSDKLPLRWGFSIYNTNSVPYITFYLCNGTIWENLSDYNYVLVGQKCFPSAKEVRASNDPLSVRTFSCSNALMNEWLYYPLTEICPNWSFGGNEITGGDSVDTVYFNKLLTCPECGGHNIGYRWSFVASGGSSFVGQNGYVFQCNDCSAKWYGWLSPSEHEQFQQYIVSDDTQDYNLAVDNSIPLPFIPSGNVQLPADTTDFASYLQNALASLTGYVDSFNGFFGSVFSILPPQVLSVILLGVGLVIVIGILKVARG